MAGQFASRACRAVSDERLARMAAKGLTMPDRRRVREAADIWLTFRAADGGPEAEAA